MTRGGWDVKDAPLVDGKSPQIRRELMAGEDGAHSRGSTPAPLQQLLVEWTAARRRHAGEQQDASLCDASAAILPTPGAFPAMALAYIFHKLCAPKKGNESRPLVSGRLTYLQACWTSPSGTFAS